MADAGPAVLSIQSHVVHGYVGNKAAVFPLQVLGVEVDAINSVHFSNHTGYPSFAGERLGGPELLTLFEALDTNGLSRYSHLLTGYIGSAAVLESVVRIAEQLKRDNPGLVYVCDPVLGDNGKLYVPEELVALFRDRVIPLSDVVIPNQFEVEQLTEGGPIASVDAAVERMAQLHAMGPRTVVISSLNEALCPDGDMLLLGSFAGRDGPGGGGAGAKPYTFTLRFPRIKDFYFTGTGDLLAALFLAWQRKFPDEPHKAAEVAIATIQAVIRRTEASSRAKSGGGADGGPRTRELRLIQSRRDIEDPDTSGLSAVCTPTCDTQRPRGGAHA